MCKASQPHQDEQEPPKTANQLFQEGADELGKIAAMMEAYAALFDAPEIRAALGDQAHYGTYLLGQAIQERVLQARAAFHRARELYEA